MWSKPSSLTVHFGCLLLLALLVGTFTFGLVQLCGGAAVERYLENSDIQERRTLQRVAEFQHYVTQNSLSTWDTAKLTAWVKTQPMLLLEIYRSNILLYTSFAPNGPLEEQDEEESPYYGWVSYYIVSFSDGEAEVVFYANDGYRWTVLLTIAALLLSFLMFLLVFLRGCQKLGRYICLLCGEIQAMEGGDLDAAITLRGNHDLTRLAQSLDSMRLALRGQQEREASILRTNQAMVTAMSHDLRTPLTALQIYTSILRLKKYTPDQLDGYIEKIDAKAAQIKQLAENIFEYSLVSHTQPVLLDPPVPFREVFHDILSETTAYLEERGFSLKPDLDWPPMEVAVYPPYIKRLVDNAVSNIVKYADPAIPVEIKAFPAESGPVLSFQNNVLPAPARQEGTHIGLANMQAMMENMGGECQARQTDLSFRIELRFSAAPEEAKKIQNPSEIL